MRRYPTTATLLPFTLFNTSAPILSLYLWLLWLLGRAGFAALGDAGSSGVLGDGC